MKESNTKWAWNQARKISATPWGDKKGELAEEFKQRVKEAGTGTEVAAIYAAGVLSSFWHGSDPLLGLGDHIELTEDQVAKLQEKK
jgi:hypothetical protein